MSNQNQKKNLILIGWLGSGKSSTGNNILKKRAFDINHKSSIVGTSSIQLESSDEYNLYDCPGFENDSKLFFDEYLTNKNNILSNIPIHGILFVVKFDDGKSTTFLHAAQKFYSIFGFNGLRCLILLCIQENNIKTLNESNFEKNLRNSDGYQFLFEKNNNQEIKYLLWDNYGINYEMNNLNNFTNCLNNLETCGLGELKSSFNNAEKMRKILQLENEITKVKNFKKSFNHDDKKKFLSFGCFKNLFSFFILTTLAVLIFNSIPSKEMLKLKKMESKSIYDIDLKNLKQSYNNYIKNGEQEMINIVKEIILKKNEELLIEIKNKNAPELDDLIGKFQKLLEFSQLFSDIIPSLKSDYDKALQKLTDIFERKIKNLNQLVENESISMKEINSDYDSLKKMENFFNISKNQMLKKFSEKILNLELKIVNNYLKSQIDLIDANFNENFQITRIVEQIKFLQSYSILIEKIDSTKNCFKFEDIALKFSDKLKIYLKDLSSFSYLKYDTINNLEVNFETYYESLNRKILTINILKSNLQSFLRSLDFDDYLNKLIDQIKINLEKLNQNIYERFDSLIKSSQFNLQNDQDLNEFNTAFYNLRSFDSKFDKKLVKKFELNFDSDKKIKGNLIDKLYDRLTKLIDKIEMKDVDSAAKIFVEMKKISNNLLFFKDEIDTFLDDTLNKYIKKNGFASIGQLALVLKMDPNGAVIIVEHKCFESYNRSIFSKKLPNINIDSVLKDLDGNSTDKAVLKFEYELFESQYKSLIQTYLKPNIDFDTIIFNLDIIINKVKLNAEKNPTSLDWDNNVKEKLSDIIAHLFGLYTLLISKNYFLEPTTLFIPHPAQVVAIFRMLGIGYNDGFVASIKKMFVVTGLRNNLVEIGTGEGKSITLGITAATLALLGFDVNCVSYSRYLSNRDYTAFMILFEKLKIVENIHYGTFDLICEESINEHGDLRQLVNNIINGKSNENVFKMKRKKRPPIILIDEVDVFFSHDFYGSSYNPVFYLNDESIAKLIEFLWTNRNTNNINDLKIVKNSEVYKNCIRKFKNWEALIEKSTLEVLYSFIYYSEFKRDYIIKNDKIAYKKQDEYSFQLSYGYFTLATYFLEHENGKISRKSLENYIGFCISTGFFSYAEIPKNNFYAILGVTGTLKTLSDTQKRIIENEYNIKHNTYMPSIYGRKNIKFDLREDVLVEKDENHFKVIVREIEKRLKGKNPGTKRAVFVAFENKEILNNFKNSVEFAHLRLDSSTLIEEVNTNEKKVIINKATISGQITLFTRIFGRGTDFIVFDEIVSANGGVHVIQTFLSEELSEEIQVKGRTARQGEDGSYNMIIARGSLNKFEIRDDELEINSNRLYDFLNDKRNKYFRTDYQKKTENIVGIKSNHEKSMEFINSILNNDFKKIQDFLLQKN